MSTPELIEALRKRAEIRRQMVLDAPPDRITDLLEEAARCIEMQESRNNMQCSLMQQFTLHAGQLRSSLDFLQKYSCWIGKTLDDSTTLECVLPSGQHKVVADNLRDAVVEMKRKQ